MTRNYKHFGAIAASAFIVACGINKPAALGDPNSIIVAAPDSLWAQVSDTVIRALEPELVTVRDMKPFRVTHVSPTAGDWLNLREFRNVVVVGRPADPWIRKVVDEGARESLDPPVILEEADVWARDQRVFAVVLPPENPAEAVASVLPELYDRIHERFREFTLRRMFASGVNTALGDSLLRRAGFSIRVPNVYAATAAESVYIFRNTNPSPGELFRSVLVAWRPGTADTLRVETALAWRDSLADRFYDYHEQVTQRDRIESRRLDGRGVRALEVHGMWATAPRSWPAAGPFITRLVACPEQDRTYLLDAWLYAPGKDKYQYMIQLDVILESFTCGPDAARRSRAPARAGTA